MSHLRIRNWDRFQHFKDRRPPWIKLHREILDNRDVMVITEKNFKILVCLWLIASESEDMDGSLPPIEDISFRLRYTEKEITRAIHELKEFIDIDDINMISKRYQDDKKNIHKQDKFEIPEGIDKQTWSDYEQMRNKIKKPMTNKAKILAISKLLKINKETGDDPNDILEQSTFNSWQGLFAVKDRSHKDGKISQYSKSNAEKCADEIARLAKKHGVTKY